MEARVSPNGADSSGSSGVDGPLPNSTRQYEPGAAGIEDHVQFSTSASDTGNSGEKRRSAEEQHRRSFEENAADVQGSIAAAKLQALIFNPRNDVVMRLECMSEKELKNILVIIKLGVFAGIILLCALFVLKFKRNERWFVDHGNIPLLNVVVGAICLATLSGSITHSSWNIRKAIHSDKRWTRRRKYSTVLFFTLPCIQIFSTLAYIVGNSYVLRGNCRWFSGVVIWCGFAQWAIGWGGTFALLAVLGHNSNPAPPLPDGSTIQTEYGLDAMVLDMPVLQYHWPKFAYLAAHITVQLGLCIYLQKNGAGDQAGIFSRHECETGNLNCVMDTVTLTLASVSIVSLVGMLCWWAISIRLAVHNFKRWSYIGHRAGNLNLRFQVRFLSYSVAFFIICCILLWFVKLQSCASFVETWLGFSPLFIVMTVTCVSMAFIYQPKQADPDMALYYVMKQAFSWTEAFKEQKLQLRNAMKPDSEHLQRAPMFCVETAIKLLYFSALCYGYQEEGATSPLNIEVALAMYDLKQHELLREVREDSKVLLAWNHRMMVIAFRGTASIKNVAADLQMWLHVHPREHRKGRRWWRVPMVHAGFHRSWTISGLSEKVLDHVRKCVDSCATPSDKPFQILLTGHSLGGALATMAAVDIAQRVCTAQHPVSISVYTFGAPRTGNHRFAEIYNDLAPDTWSVSAGVGSGLLCDVVVRLHT
mmetsp:Transcript_17938/g.53981  ORF Transcript_17938/g.53981 Transcript_17938/m.53981 type:complete len:703 (+) Transcript_17938:404-2512(+)